MCTNRFDSWSARTALWFDRPVISDAWASCGCWCRHPCELSRFFYTARRQISSIPMQAYLRLGWECTEPYAIAFFCTSVPFSRPMYMYECQLLEIFRISHKPSTQSVNQSVSQSVESLIQKAVITGMMMVMMSTLYGAKLKLVRCDRWSRQENKILPSIARQTLLVCERSTRL